jgi:adenylylsulfate kinase-like enzyme/sugar phosphate permease
MVRGGAMSIRAARPRISRPVLAAAVLSATNFLMVFDGLVVTVALPSIQRSFGFSPLDLQWVLTAYSLPLGGMLLLGGRCGDRYGRRRTLMAGLEIFVIGLVAAGLAPTGEVLLAARALQGIGAALAIPNSYALISMMRSTKRRHHVFAAVAVAGSGAAAGGAVIGGIVTQTFGWRYVFLLSAPVAIGAILMAPKVLDAGRDHQRPSRLDPVGAVLSTLGLSALVFAITNIERAGLLSMTTLCAFVLAVAVLAGFALREMRSSVPLLRPALLRLTPLRAAVVGMPGQVFAYTGTVFIGLLFFQQARGYSAVQAGLAFAPLGVAAGLGSPLTTHLLARWRWTIVAMISQTICSAGLLLIAIAPPQGAYVAYFLPGLVLLGVGIAGAAVSFNVAAGSKVPDSEKGVGYGLFETSTHISGALVVAVLATVAAWRTRSATGLDDRQALAAGYQLAFAVAASAAFAAGILAMIVGRGRSYSGDAVDSADSSDAAGPTSSVAPQSADGPPEPASRDIGKETTSSAETLRAQRDHAGAVIWVTGLAGAGKTTVARTLAERLRDRGVNPILLDGDVMRQVMQRHSEYDLDSRLNMGFTYARVGKALAEQGHLVIVATISLFHTLQEWNRANLPRYVEVLLDVPMHELRRRDQHGLYSGGADPATVVGLGQPAQFPQRPDIVIENHGHLSPSDAAAVILRRVRNRLLVFSNN